MTDQYLKTAYSYLYIRDFKRATEAFRSAIMAEPESSENYFHGSVTALRNGDCLLAAAWANEALRRDTRNPLYLEHVGIVNSTIAVKHGKCAWLHGQPITAFRLFRDALVFDPLNVDAVDAVNVTMFCGSWFNTTPLFSTDAMVDA